MILKLKGGSIDISNEQVNVDWQNIRFSGGLRDAYTTDIQIPANHKNINILNCSGLLDSPQQKFGDYITPATVTISDEPMDVLVEVSSITEETITLTLFEQTIPAEYFDKKIGDYFVDDWNSIWVWSVNSDTDSSGMFRKYDYGMSFNDRYAQYHPTMKLNDLIAEISNQTNYNFQLVDDDLYLMATKKTVCPQNTRQMIHCWCGESSSGTKPFYLCGGQHVVNDLEGVDYNTKFMESDVTKITFNRHCVMTGYLYYSMRAKAVGSLPSSGRVVALMKNGQFLDNKLCTWNGSRCGLGVYQLMNYTFEAGDVLEIKATNPQYNKFFQVILDVEYSDYQIEDEDYGEELKYAPNHPTLYFFPNTDIDDREPMYFDYRFWSKNLGGGVSFGMFLPYRGYSYFGYYCNLPSFSVKDLIHSMCWYLGKKPKMVNDTISYVDANESAVLKLGIVSTKQPCCDKLGKASEIGYNNDKAPTTIHFDNFFTENEKWLHKSVFEYVANGKNGLGKIDQYSIETDDEGKVTVNFEDIQNPVIMSLQQNNGGGWILKQPHEIGDLGIGNLTTIMQCKIDTYDKVKDLDYVYLDGRKFMVIDGTYDTSTHLSTLNTLLISTSIPKYNNIIIIPAIGEIVKDANDNYDIITNVITNTNVFEGRIRVWQRTNTLPSVHISNAEINPTSALISIKVAENLPSVGIDEVSIGTTMAKISIDVVEPSIYDDMVLIGEWDFKDKDSDIALGKLNKGDYYVEIEVKVSYQGKTKPNVKYKKAEYTFQIK